MYLAFLNLSIAVLAKIKCHTGHHTKGNYLRYDRTKALKMDAHTLVPANSLLYYDCALKEISEKFVEEHIVRFPSIQ